MKITEIAVSAGRKVQHPFLPYSSIDPWIMLKAQLTEEDDPDSCLRELQARAEGAVQDIANLTVNALGKLQDKTAVERVAFNLTDALAVAHHKLDDLRRERNLVSDPKPAPVVSAPGLD